MTCVARRAGASFQHLAIEHPLAQSVPILIFKKPRRGVGRRLVMLVLVAGLLLALVPFLVFMGPIIVWAAWPTIALLAAVYAVHAIQRRRHMTSLAHQS